jgi:hypothetical protein
MLMSSARKPGRDSHVFAVYVKQSSGWRSL